MNTLELCTIRKSYDQFVAVDDLSFQITPGQIYGLLGPNGAGKTSSIRMIIGITLPDTGLVRMFGEPFRRTHLDKVGYLPEERGLYRKMKLREQLVFLGELKGLASAEALRRTKSWCERLELTDWLDKKVEELSKGMQQKVQFIGALLHDPDFIIMDEPFSGLDPSNAVVLKDVLLDLKRAGKTILFSTHRMDHAERLCDAICLINRGKAVLEGDL
jgi:ABC-2 type transport system ATP-binding protein